MRHLLGLSFLFLTAASGVSAQVIPDRPLISVIGQAEVKVVPDEAAISLHINNLDKNLAPAKKLNDEKVGKVFALTQKYSTIAIGQISITATVIVSFELK